MRRFRRLGDEIERLDGSQAWKPPQSRSCMRPLLKLFFQSISGLSPITSFRTDGAFFFQGYSADRNFRLVVSFLVLFLQKDRYEIEESRSRAGNRQVSRANKAPPGWFRWVIQFRTRREAVFLRGTAPVFPRRQAYKGFRKLILIPPLFNIAVLVKKLVFGYNTMDRILCEEVRVEIIPPVTGPAF